MIFIYSQRSSCGQRTGLTLIELLTVVAVIAVLAGMVLALLDRARSKAEATQCRSNLRKIQLASIAYAADSPEGRFVPTYINGSESAADGRVMWHSNRGFLAFLDIGTEWTTAPWPPLFWPRDLLCAAATIEGGRIDRCYASNRHGLPNSGYNEPGVSAGARVTDVVRPSRVIAFVDAPNWMVNYPLSPYAGEVTTNNALAYRHDGKANVVFFDGHVETYSPDVLEQTQSMWQISQ